jgi:phosphopantothenoylcysteine decarboxylase/phosphopantothenate--cysteine ligase
MIVEPESGYLACGEEGEGRLAEPEAIVEEVVALLRRGESLKGRKVLVTAGPTVEDLDPVRFISNRSSGKMGYAIAQEAVRRGADVVLVSGPCALKPPHGAVLVSVRSAAEMASGVFDRFSETDIVVMAAAVGDYRPVRVSEQKLKKSQPRLTLELEATADILKCLGERKTRQLLVGFAAESENLVEHARRKLQEKNLDLIVANDISGPSSTFGSDNNQVTLIDSSGSVESLNLLPKSRVAEVLWSRIEAKINGSGAR